MTWRRFLRRYPKARLLASAAALLWRRLMFRTTFIAITGSVGKTTATECLTSILASCFHINGTRHGRNSGRELAAVVLRTRARHRFTVLEVGTNLPGALRKAAWMIAPDVVVILAVAAAHSNHFAALDDIAAEKAQLLSRLGPRGLAILNGDDPRVAAMAARCRARIVTFGRSPQFDLWADDVSSAWPSRLSFRVHHRGENRRVQTRLVGEHWLSSVLGALAAALWNGVELERAVAAVEQVEPTRGRLQPVPLTSGALMLRDENSSSFTTLRPALRILEQAQGRRVLVFHDEFDSGFTFRKRLRLFGELAARSTDLILLFGNESRRAGRAAIEGGADPEKVLSLPDLRAAAEHLKTILGPGDVVLLRGRASDHVERIYFAQLGSVGCHAPTCGSHSLCDYCPELQPGLEEAARLPAPASPYWLPRDR